MKREDFIKIIKLRSIWKIDKRKGNYKLPSGERLSKYISKLIQTQMKIDNLGIMENGDLCFCQGGNWNIDKKEFDNFTLMPAFKDNENCSYDDMDKRISKLIYEIVV